MNILILHLALIQLFMSCFICTILLASLGAPFLIEIIPFMFAVAVILYIIKER